MKKLIIFIVIVLIYLCLNYSKHHVCEKKIVKENFSSDSDESIPLPQPSDKYLNFEFLDDINNYDSMIIQTDKNKYVKIYFKKLLILFFMKKELL